MVPETRTKTVCVHKSRCEERSGTYCVTKMVPEARTKTVCVNKCRVEARTREVTVNRCVAEQRSKEVSYTVMVPQQRTKSYTVCASDSVTETKTESYVVRVPKKVTKTQCVTVRKCVEEQVPADELNAGNGNGSIGTLNGAFAYFVQLAQGQDREGIDFGIRPIPQPPPKVTANVIQGGMSQRSFVDRVEIDFSTRVNLDDLIRSGAITSAVSLVNLGITADSDPDQSVPLNANQFRYEFDATSGRSRLTWSLDAFSNATQSLPNGSYRLRLATSMITDADVQRWRDAERR
jgi:hypothetical protein